MTYIPSLSSHIISAGNSTSTPLGASATFTGQWEDVTDYATVAVAVLGSIQTDGTLYFDLSTDGGSTFTSVPSTIGDTTFAVPRILNVVETHVRIRYVNGTTTQVGGTFSIQTKYSNAQELDLLGSVDGFVNGETPTSLVKSVSVGQNPTGGYENQKIDGVSFKTTANLNAGATFDSGVLSLIGFSQVQTQIVCNENGTLKFIFGSSDTMTGSTVGVNGVDRVISLPYEASKGFELFSAPAFTDYVRYEFTNDGASTTTHLLFETKFLTKALSGQVLSTNAPIASGMVANLGRNILVGQDSTGNFRNVPTDSEGNLYIHLQRPTSAFGDLISVELTPQAQVTFPYNINTDIVDIEELNGGTVTQASSMAVLQTSTATNGEATLDSRQILKYRAGLGGLARFTGLFTTGVANSEQIIGIGDDEDGYFFGYVGTAFGILIRKNSVDEFIPQTSWNVDNMDGNDGISNPSNILLDPTKINVFEIEFQWLGAGQIDFHIEDPNTGHFTPVHRVKYANNNTDPSIFNPSFPLHANIKNTGNATNLTMKTASMAAFCEGKSIVNGPRRSFGNLKAISAELALFSLQNKSTFQTKTNRISSFIKSLSVGNDINQLAVIKIYRNTTLGGTPVFTDVNTANSPIQTDVAGTTVTGGDLLYEFVVGKDSGADFTFDIPDLDMRPGDVITFTASSGGAGDVSASVSWIEDQ